MAYVLVAIGLIGAFIRWRLYTIRLHYERETAFATASAAEEANEAKSAFLSTVSHELRSPLTSIIGFAKLNKRSLNNRILPALPVEDPKAQKAASKLNKNLDVITTEGERLSELINDLLDLAKIESGQIDWKMEEIQHSALIERAISSTASLFDQKQSIELKTDISDSLPTIHADNNRLLQVLINLISNAIKFTDSGYIKIGSYSKPGPQNAELIFYVNDTGSGIPTSHIDEVFEKFKQVDDNQDGKPKGTGLGLPICKEIVEHHKGKIWVESEIGKGSTFYFSIPVG